ncbi:MAG TPA: DoxX family protein [Burkholderiales bacterium]
MQSASSIETATGAADARWTDVADVAGRIALAAMFIMAGADKLFAHTAETVQMMEAYRVPLAGLLIYPAGVVELAGGLALAAGYRARWAAMLLALFTAGVSPVFHAFWAVPADQALVQMLFFTKNLAVFGGLLHVVARGTGRFALQRE